MNWHVGNDKLISLYSYHYYFWHTTDYRSLYLLLLGIPQKLYFESNMVMQVSVTPGGRWSRFKTYSTIQRTLEIWGFVLTFVVRVWLNNQKFSYRG